MKSWNEFSCKEREISELGKRMLFPARPHIGLAFLATIRKDGSPRLHPVSLVCSQDHLYVFFPINSPKCGDLKRDGRYALQAFPPPDNEPGREFYLAGAAHHIQDVHIRQAIIIETGAHVEESEQLFELLINQAMYTTLIDCGTSNERPLHRIWRDRASL